MLSVDCFATQNLPVAMDRDPGASPLSVPLLGCCVNLGCFCHGYPACPLIALVQHVTAGTCGRTGHHKLHVWAQYQWVCTFCNLGSFLARDPELSKWGHWVDLFLKNESCRLNLNCKSHGMAVVWVPCKTLPWMPFGCVPAVLNHTCNGELCTVVAIYPVFLEHLMFCKLVNTLFHGSGCTLEVAVFCQHLRWLLSRLCHDVSVACESFILEKSQDLKQHALVNNLVWLLNRK